MKGWTRSAGTSSAAASEAPTGATSTPTRPSKAAQGRDRARCRTLCRQNINLPLEALLRRLNPVLRGWTTYFRPGVSSIAFDYLRAFTWRQVVRLATPQAPPASTGRNSADASAVDGWWPADGDVILFNPGAVRTTRYRYRGTQDPVALAERSMSDSTTDPSGLVESRMRRRGARPVREAGRGNGPVETPAPRPGPTSPRQRPAGSRTSCACW